MGWIETLKELRLLPPPANELVPLLSTNLCYFLLKKLLFADLQRSWNKFWLIESASSSYDEAQTLFVYGSFCVYMAMYWGYSILVHAAEHKVPSLAHFKIQPTISTPLSEVFRMAPLVLFNQFFIGIPLLKIFFNLYCLRLGGETAQVASRVMAVPSIGRFAVIIFLHVLCTEFWFYSVHRLLHSNRFLYTHFHSLHHKYKAPSCLESVYVHPVEFALNSFTVIFVGPLVTGAPLIALWMWVWMVTFLQVHDHSGYWLPFLPRVLMHDYHHQEFKCCYGVLGLLDGIFKTEGGFQAFVKAKETETITGDKEK